MISSVWKCPACGHKELHSDPEDNHLEGGLWMWCQCSKCYCIFMVNVTSTEDEEYDPNEYYH